MTGSPPSPISRSFLICCPTATASSSSFRVLPTRSCPPPTVSCSGMRHGPSLPCRRRSRPSRHFGATRERRTRNLEIRARVASRLKIIEPAVGWVPPRSSFGRNPPKGSCHGQTDLRQSAGRRPRPRHRLLSGGRRRKERAIQRRNRVLYGVFRDHPRHVADPPQIPPVHAQKDRRCQDFERGSDLHLRRQPGGGGRLGRQGPSRRRRGRSLPEAGLRLHVWPQFRGSRRPHLGSNVDGCCGRNAVDNGQRLINQPKELIDVKNFTLPVVRRRGRGSRKLLRFAFARFEDRVGAKEPRR